MSKSRSKNPNYTKINRNTKRAFLRSRGKVVVEHGRTYNVGKNKAKREARSIYDHLAASVNQMDAILKASV